MCLLVMSIPADELSTPAWQRAIVVSIRATSGRQFCLSFGIYQILILLINLLQFCGSVVVGQTVVRPTRAK